MMKTVVAVTYGSSWSGGEIDCEVLTYPLDQALSENQLGPLIAASVPTAGELDDRMGLKARVDRLTELGGHYEKVPEVALREAEYASAGLSRQVSSEDYSEEIGQVIVFDAHVDDVTGSVDWSTAVPHPTVDPYDLGPDAWYQRADGTIIDGSALLSGRHRVAIRHDGRRDTVNEFGSQVIGLSDEELASFSQVDTSGMPVADMVVCTVVDSDGNLRSAAQPLDVVQSMGGRFPDPRENGFRSAAAYHEMFVSAAGASGQLISTESSGQMWVGVVRAPHGQAQPAYGNNYPIVAQQAGPPSSSIELSPSRDYGQLNMLKGAEVPSMGSMAVSMASRIKSSKDQPDDDHRRRERVRGGPVGPTAAPASSRYRGPVGVGSHRYELEDQLGSRSSVATPHEPSKRSRALAGMSSKAREAAAKHGPQVAKAVRGAMEDPVLRDRLRTAGQLAVTAALATQGGGKAKLAAGLAHAARNPEVRGMAKQAGRAAVSKAASSKGYQVPGL